MHGASLASTKLPWRQQGDQGVSVPAPMREARRKTEQGSERPQSLRSTPRRMTSALIDGTVAHQRCKLTLTVTGTVDLLLHIQQ